jgi:hypothetical protein
MIGQRHAPAAYPRGNRPHGGCVGPMTERYGEENIFLLLLGIEPQLLGRPARSLVGIQSELSRGTD